MVYWVAGGAVLAKPADGGATLMLGGNASDNTGLTVDDTHVYWTSMGDGQVFRTPRDGVGPTVEIAAFADPVSIAAGCEDVVVTVSLGSSSARLVRFPK
jgi:hypothetical protein